MALSPDCSMFVDRNFLCFFCYLSFWQGYMKYSIVKPCINVLLINSLTKIKFSLQAAIGSFNTQVTFFVLFTGLLSLCFYGQHIIFNIESNLIFG